MLAALKTILQGAVLGLLGLCVAALGTQLSAQVAELPVQPAMRLLVRAATGDDGGITNEAARAVLEADHWYEYGILPGVAGVICGLLAGLVARLRIAVATMAAFAFLALNLLWSGGHLLSDLAAWAGFLLFPFCLLGASSLAGSWQLVGGHRAASPVPTRATESAK